MILIFNNLGTHSSQLTLKLWLKYEILKIIKLYNMLIFILLIQSLVLAQETSQGVLATAIEELGEETSQFSAQSSAAFKSLNTKLETEQNFTSSTSESLISSKISELKTEYNKISEELAPLRASYEKAAKNCNEHLSCSSCKTSESCVWCTVEEKCVNGDEYGPTEGDCTDYLYQECTYAGCEEYKDCSTCIGDSNCGWCNIGHTCYEGTEVLKGDCSFKYYYHSAGNTDCPEYTQEESECNDNAEEVILKEINRLEDILNDIQAEIDELEEAKEQIVRKASKKIDLEDDPELAEYEGMTEKVDEKAKKETEEELEWKKKLWENWKNQVNEDIDEDIQEEFDEVIGEINEYMKPEKKKD
jgi:hypothetical protein